LLEYISILRIKNILDGNFDTDSSNNLETELYNIQNIILRIFVRNIIDHTYHHLINGLPYIKNQYFILQKYMNLGTYTQIYEIAKKLYIMKFNIIELTINIFNSFYNTVTDTGLIII
jgi:Iap family predicted aminopeptidase